VKEIVFYERVNMEIIRITKENVEDVISTFGMIIDESGFIIDPKTKKRVKCKYTGRELTKKTLGGVLPGSLVFIEDSDEAYSRYIVDFLSVANEK